MSESTLWIIGGIAITIVLIVLRIRVLRSEKAEMNDTADIVETDGTQSQSTVNINDEPIENRQEVLAAICAAIAEENDTDISALRVISFKKV